MFTLTIKTDNAAFDEGDKGLEVARILRELANRLETQSQTSGTLRDANGNTVGTWKLTGAGK